MTVCDVNECDLNVCDERGKCILHCTKEEYSVDYLKAGFLTDFYIQLIDHIIVSMSPIMGVTEDVNRDSLRNYLSGNVDSRSGAVRKFLKESEIVLSHIFFPGRNSRDRFDYAPVLNKLGAIHFNCCKFAANDINLGNVKAFYQDCMFVGAWRVYGGVLLENVANSLYKGCNFGKSVSVESVKTASREMSCSLFSDCDFNESLNIHSLTFHDRLFRNADNNKTRINELVITDCTFEDKFILNDCHIEKYVSDGNVFKSKFEFKNNEVGLFMVTDTNHAKLVDTYKTRFIKFSIHKSIFEDFVGFEECIFGSVDSVDANNNMAVFVYATFLSFVNFRFTSFLNGLDIKRINLKESPNFLGAKINGEMSNRETFRIIKHSFDKIGNHVEANKYFAYEMEKYKNELTWSGAFQDKLILLLNEAISSFGQSYIKPIIWIVIVSALFGVVEYGYENDALYNIYPPANDLISKVATLLNELAKSILPFEKFLKKGMEFVSVLFYAVYASLIWLTIVAIKRHTKR